MKIVKDVEFLRKNNKSNNNNPQKYKNENILVLIEIMMIFWTIPIIG